MSPQERVFGSSESITLSARGLTSSEVETALRVLLRSGRTLFVCVRESGGEEGLGGEER